MNSMIGGVVLELFLVRPFFKAIQTILRLQALESIKRSLYQRHEGFERHYRSKWQMQLGEPTEHIHIYNSNSIPQVSLSSTHDHTRYNCYRAYAGPRRDISQ